VFIEHSAKNSMASFNFTSAVPNGSGGFNNHLANPKKPKAFAPTSSHNIDNLANDLGGIKLSDLIGSYASHIKVNLARRSVLTI
jgi:hypothetical protein